MELVIELKIAEIFSSPLFHGCFIDCFVVFFFLPPNNCVYTVYRYGVLKVHKCFCLCNTSYWLSFQRFFLSQGAKHCFTNADF